jgi:hypothetical protein
MEQQDLESNSADCKVLPILLQVNVCSEALHTPREMDSTGLMEEKKHIHCSREAKLSLELKG